MTTTPIEGLTTTSQPRKGVDNTPLPDLAGSTSLGTIAFTATDTAASASGTADANDDNDNNHKDKKSKDNKAPPGQLDPTAERALIAAGSIGKLDSLVYQHDKLLTALQARSFSSASSDGLCIAQ
jgi:hypothetical protein